MTRPAAPSTANADDTGGYDPIAVEARWQALWRELGTNHVDLERGERPLFALMMFPYPSAEGLHVGNLFAFTGNDIYGRFQRLRGHTVFEPFGYDAFGIHSENHALKVGMHPMRLIPRSIANFERQVERAGLMIDWRYRVDTTDPSYYRWTQWVFVQLYRQGLAYRKKAAVNWCPVDKTVLSNEQVVAGACERCGALVEQRALEQWFFRISDYAGRLLDNLAHLDWSPTTRSAQRNWIGRSEGAEIRFPVAGGDALITVFTTRPDTIFGATWMVLAPEHPLVDGLTTPDRADDVRRYRERTARQDLVTRRINKEKTGVFTGGYAINPATGDLIPIWISDYVVMDYGTGAIMAVPGHDERDFEFARTFNLPVIRVIAAQGEHAETPLTNAWPGDGSEGDHLVNSGQFNGLSVAEGTRRIVAWLESRGAATPRINYRLHDWCISRQRYWGPPIPIVHCETCGPVAVPESELPVRLPQITNFQPDDSGVSPLARHKEWYEVSCPQCAGMARRETDVSDTFLDSGWYFLRYPSVRHDDVPFDPAITKRWLPVDSYIGGNEHAVLHLLYARFLTMVLKDMGYLSFEEPFKKFRAHGLIIRDGAKMSKSKGNVVVPDEYIAQWGADAFRTYLMFLGPFEEGGDFRDAGISGVKRFLDRLWSSVNAATSDGAPDAAVMRKLHQTIRKVTDDIASLGYNTAIAAMMEYINVLRKEERTPHRSEVDPLVQLVAPFAPHLAEEAWERLGYGKSVMDSGWPAYDADLAREEMVQLAVQINGKVRGAVKLPPNATQDAALSAALADPAVAKYVTGEIRKVVFVAGRLLSLVV
ncbi:MAG: leucine--tRNA ligase [Gemmatimonadota bacterium]